MSSRDYQVWSWNQWLESEQVQVFPVKGTTAHQTTEILKSPSIVKYSIV